MEKFIASVLSIILFIGLGLAPIKTSASGESEVEQDELEKELEFLFEEVITLDENGEPKEIDIDKAEENFGDSPEMELLREEAKKLEEQKNTIQPRINPSGPNGEATPVRKCMNNKIKEEWGMYLSGAVFTNLIDALASGNYKKGAKYLAKAGIRTTGVSAAVTLGGFWVTCYNA